MHDNNIVHRDIKPQNIFYDEENDCYVIGDLGIAHFSNDNFPKNSKTKIGERLANFDFCAPEQSQKNYIPHPSCDIYSLGQVLQWYITGQTIRGLGRTPFVFTNLSKYLLYLDKIIQKCLLNNPKDRYQKIADIFEDIKTWDSSTKTKNYWEIICSFENAIVKSFPRIIKTLETVNKSEIETFLSNFHEICKLDDFWYMDTDEGDNSYSPIFIDQSGIMVFCNDYEIEIEKLIIHHNEAIPYTNFFILMTKKLQPFNMVDNTGNKINRKASMRWKCDHAILHDGQYISPSETRNGYYEKSKNEIIAVNSNDFLDRYRSLRKFAYIIVPAGTATAIMIDRSPTGRLLQDICKKSKMTSTALKSYLNNIRGHHSHDITKYL